MDGEKALNSEPINGALYAQGKAYCCQAMLKIRGNT
jgi:hypothetical protein